jgi:hypothetical protein
MPADDPAAYQEMSTDQLVDMIEQEMAALGSGNEHPEAQMLPGELPEDVAMDADAEEALGEMEDPVTSDADAEAAIDMIMSSGVSNAGELLDQLRSQGFEIVRVGGMDQGLPEEGPEPELPMRDARKAAAERAVGGAA